MFSKVCRRAVARHLSTKTVTPRVCVVGSGPAGFYVVQHLVKNHDFVEVDIFERLPVPFGLVRYGVAPDHPEVKNVINTFTKTAHHPRVNFLGNVTLGQSVSLRDLQAAYHAVVLTYGAEEDRRLGIDGEDLPGVLSARRFVGWYNGLPEDVGLPVQLDCDTAVVLGQGNVAIDVARVLLTSIDTLKKTDISAHALATLSTSRVRRVVVVGRRGPLHVAFTIKEFREMLKLPGVNTTFVPGQMDGVKDAVSSLARPRRRLTELILQASSSTPSSANKTFHLVFLRSPLSLLGESRVSAVQLAVNTLQGDVLETQKAVDSGDRETLDCGLVLRSIGYRSVAADPDLPFDSSRSVVIQRPGLYASGWVATGPVGVILSTMTDSFTTADTVLRHFSNGEVDTSQPKPGIAHILSLLRQKEIPTVDFDGWERIDKVEVERGKAVGKPREKIIDVEEMLKIGGAVR